MRIPFVLVFAVGCTWITAEDIASRTGGDDSAPDSGGVDGDGDGHSAAEDCDDDDKAVYPGATEICDDGRVNDCAGTEAAAGEHCAWSGTVRLEDPEASLSGAEAGDATGLALASGDLNGDGVEDLAVGAPGRDGGAGAVWLVPGPVSGAASVTETGAELSGEGLLMAGFSVAGASDLDGDGYDDLLIGGPEREHLDGGNCSDGAVWLVAGPPTAGALADVAAADWRGTEAACLGHGVALVGDINDDGAPELLAGEPGLGNPDFGGRAWLLSGASVGSSDPDGALLVGATGSLGGYAVSGPGDLDGDGQPDIAVGAPGTSEARVYVLTGLSGASVTLEDEAWIITNEEDDDKLGAAITGAGDLDGDGYGDLLLGARVHDTGGTSAGAAYLIAGPITASSYVQYARARLYGVAEGDEAGRALTAPGDLDGDGVGEIAVGAPGHDEGASEGGGVYIVSGDAEGSFDLDQGQATLVSTTALTWLGRALTTLPGDDGEQRLILGATGPADPNDSNGPYTAGSAIALDPPHW